MKKSDLKQIVKEEVERVITEQILLREFWETAGAVTVGILGALAAIKGFGLVKYIAGETADKVSDSIDRISTLIKKRKDFKMAKEIAQKFEGDSELKNLFAQLRQNPSDSFNGKILLKRKSILRQIHKYIDSKLTEDEKYYLNILNKGIRDKQIEI